MQFSPCAPSFERESLVLAGLSSNNFLKSSFYNSPHETLERLASKHWHIFSSFQAKVECYIYDLVGTIFLHQFIPNLACL